MVLGKITNPQFQAALSKLASQEVPLKTAFVLKGIISTLNDELKKYDEVRNEALQRLGTKDEKGNVILDQQNVRLSKENMKHFIDQMNALLNLEVNVNTIKIEDLGDKVSLSADDLVLLEDIVVN